ncbi:MULTISPECIES: cytochrome P450 [unclassified Modestobacter]
MAIDLPVVTGDLTDTAELHALRRQHWVARSDRGYEVLTYDEGFEVLEHPDLRKGPTFQYRLDAMGIDGEARRYYDLTMPNSEGEYRKRLRAPIAGLFRPAQVKKQREEVRRIARQTVAEIEAADEVDLMQQLCWLVPARTYCALFGMPQELARDVIRIGDSTLGAVLTVDRSRRQEAMETVLEAVELARTYLHKRRTDPGEDFMSVLIRQQEKGLLTEDELFAETLSILQASVDNTAHQMGNTFGALLEDRSRWEAFLHDRALAKPVVEEVIRLYPRFCTVFRYAPVPVTIRDLEVEAGSWVFVSTRAAQRDPEVFPDPDSYRLDRDAKRPPMFGAGPYNCLGQNLARAEIEETVLAVADAYPDIQLTGAWGRRRTNAVSETTGLPVSLG